MTITQLLKQAEQQLSFSSTPRLDAEILLAHVLKQDRAYLYAWPEKILSDAELNNFQQCLNRRSQNEPIAYITGYKEFWSLPFHVSKATLIPRPETEIIIEQILSLPEQEKIIQVADLGTGCGTIALSIAKEKPHWQIHATDNSKEAIAIAKQNAARFKLNQVVFHEGNWCAALPEMKFDIIVSNPPYIAEDEWEDYANGLVYEPKSALISGSAGLDAISEIVKQAKAYLKPDGYIFLEHGFNQGVKVHDVFTKEGYQKIITHHDLSGQARVTSGRYLPT